MAEAVAKGGTLGGKLSWFSRLRQNGDQLRQGIDLLRNIVRNPARLGVDGGQAQKGITAVITGLLAEVRSPERRQAISELTKNPLFKTLVDEMAKSDERFRRLPIAIDMIMRIADNPALQERIVVKAKERLAKAVGGEAALLQSLMGLMGTGAVGETPAAPEPVAETAGAAAEEAPASAVGATANTPNADEQEVDALMSGLLSLVEGKLQGVLSKVGSTAPAATAQ